MPVRECGQVWTLRPIGQKHIQFVFKGAGRGGAGRGGAGRGRAGWGGVGRGGYHQHLDLLHGNSRDGLYLGAALEGAGFRWA